MSIYQTWASPSNNTCRIFLWNNCKGCISTENWGYDATAGFIEIAGRELGPRRIIFGSHLPSRSLGTEFSKVTAANISIGGKKLILAENYRTLLRPILKTKKT